jgi:hypothetical protein
MLRNISNAGGMGGIFFFFSFYTAILKPTFFFELVFQATSSDYGYGTEETPLVVLRNIWTK